MLYSVLFRFGHIRRWDQCAVYILYSKISTDPGLLKIRHSHRFVAVVIQFLISLVSLAGFQGAALCSFASTSGFEREVVIIFPFISSFRIILCDLVLSFHGSFAGKCYCFESKLLTQCRHALPLLVFI